MEITSKIEREGKPMLWTVTGILVVLWLVGMIVSCTLSGSILIIFIIVSISFLLAALILLQVIRKKEKH